MWDYVEELFSEDVIETMFSQYTGILDGLLDGEAGYRLGIREADRTFIEAYNATDVETGWTTLDRLFAERAERVPDRVAVKKGEESLCYGELDRRSNQVAWYLRERGIGRGDYVGVDAHRDIRTMVNLMGILKAGAAYVPVDADYPENRKRYIIENSGCRLWVGPDFYEKEGIGAYSCERAGGVAGPEDTAYVMYTSGSTGRPKGVVMGHGAVVNTIQDINKRFGVSEEDRILGISSMCFDLSVYDIFGAFSSGAMLVLIDDIRDVWDMGEVMEREGITIWNSVPAIMDLMLLARGQRLSGQTSYWEAGVSSKMVVRYEESEALRLVLLSGDWIPLSLPGKVKERFPYAEVISLGGATEASIWSIYHPIEEVRESWRSIPYGKPLGNQKFYVLNYEMEHCPVGVEGELYIGGAGVAKGYINDRAKTEAAFLEHPQLGRLYRTGDYGVYRREGWIEFTGRKDEQVKIRGHRIELGEIENCLIEHEDVRNAVVADYADGGRKYLCAYIVSSTEVKAEALREHLASELPDYMVPACFMQIEHIPLTPNGKVDRKALPEPQVLFGSTTEYVAPRDEVERRLVEVWEEVLEVEGIGVDDNFFDLGGDSSKAIRIFSMLSKEFDASITTIIQFQTVSGLASAISETACHGRQDGQGRRIRRGIRPRDYAVSGNQRMMYWMAERAPLSLAMNRPAFLELRGSLDKKRLEASIRKVVDHHDSLRTTFSLA